MSTFICAMHLAGRFICAKSRAYCAHSPVKWVTSAMRDCTITYDCAQQMWHIGLCTTKVIAHLIVRNRYDCHICCAQSYVSNLLHTIICVKSVARNHMCHICCAQSYVQWVSSANTCTQWVQHQYIASLPSCADGRNSQKSALQWDWKDTREMTFRVWFWYVLNAKLTMCVLPTRAQTQIHTRT